MLLEFFTKVINMSMNASVVILIVWIARAFLWKAPKKYAYILWLIVAIRLICPVGIASPFSVYNLVENESMQIKQYKSVEKNVDIIDNNTNNGINQNKKDFLKQVNDIDGKTDVNGLNDNEAEKKNISSLDNVSTKEQMKSTNEMASNFINIGSYIWIGICIMIFLWNIYLMLRMKKRVSRAVRLKENIYECENISTPFVMGVVCPKIYIPFRLKEKEQSYIIYHERYHIKRKDNVVKFIAFFICCVYWFQPLVWVSYLLMVRDMEMSCDEYVLKKSPEDIRVAYSESLLGFATNKRNLGLGFLAFGESDAKKRIKNVMKYKGYGKWIGIVAVILLIVVGVSCLTDTYNAKNSIDKENADRKSEPVSESFWQDGNIFTAWLTRNVDGSAVEKPCVVLVKEKEKNKFEVIVRCDFNKEYDNIHLGTFIVSQNEIIKEVDGGQEIVWAKKEVSDKLPEDEKGSHNSIKIEGKEVKYTYYNNRVETGYYERITFTKEKELQEFVSGFGAERDLIQLGGIEFNSENVIELTNGVGTGTWYSTYYNTKKDTFSKAYWYTIARYGDNRIAYITKTRKIAIVDLFSKKKAKLYTLDFADSIAVPGSLVTKAEFLNRDELRVTYVSGDDYKEITETIYMKLYTDEELVKLASDFYYRKNHAKPPIVEIDSETEGIVTIHLYEINEEEGHTATWGWYYIDRATGKGKDFFDKEVDLTTAISSKGIESIKDKNILKVLKNEKQYYNTEVGKELYLKDYNSTNTVDWKYGEGKCIYSNDSSEDRLTISYWCEVDMDSDGNQEVILQFEPNGTQVVLHCENDIVYAWAFKFRAMKNIKVDGTFECSGSAADTEIWKLKFRDGECYCEEICVDDELEKGNEIYRINKRISSREKVKKYLEQQNQKEDVLWMKY